MKMFNWKNIFIVPIFDIHLYILRKPIVLTDFNCDYSLLLEL